MKLKKIKITYHISLIIWCLSICTYMILNYLNLTTPTNYVWYELLLSITQTITSFVICWYLGYTYKENKKKNEPQSKQD